MPDPSLNMDDSIMVILTYDEILDLAVYATKFGRQDIVAKLRGAVGDA